MDGQSPLTSDGIVKRRRIDQILSGDIPPGEVGREQGDENERPLQPDHRMIQWLYAVGSNGLVGFVERDAWKIVSWTAHSNDVAAYWVGIFPSSSGAKRLRRPRPGSTARISTAFWLSTQAIRHRQGSGKLRISGQPQDQERSHRPVRAAERHGAGTAGRRGGASARLEAGATCEWGRSGQSVWNLCDRIGQSGHETVQIAPEPVGNDRSAPFAVASGQLHQTGADFNFRSVGEA